MCDLHGSGQDISPRRTTPIRMLTLGRLDAY
jgi:hypothetical protein